MVVLSFDNLVVSVVVTILDLSMGDESLIRILEGLFSQTTNRDPAQCTRSAKEIAYPKNYLPIIILSLLP